STTSPVAYVSLLHAFDLSLFFLSCCGDHRYLLSFPTTLFRSALGNRVSALEAGKSARYYGTWTDINNATAGQTISNGSGGGASRSEEHTSELQSRENLVCRLLLEKKKNETRIRESHITRHTNV